MNKNHNLKNTNIPDKDAESATSESSDYSFLNEDSLNVNKRKGAYLPHWTQENVIYAVTFRLVDSLPRAIIESWIEDRNHILSMAQRQNRPLSLVEEQRLHKLFSEKVDRFLDSGHGECWLKRDGIAEIVLNSMQHFNGKRYMLWAWCIMPNHVHIVIQPSPGYLLKDIIHSLKSFSSKRANGKLGRQGSFWQSEYYDHIVRDEEDLYHSIQYVLNNPENAGIQNWKWCGSID